MAKKPENIVKDLCNPGGPTVKIGGNGGLGALATRLRNRHGGETVQYLRALEEAVKDKKLIPDYRRTRGDSNHAGLRIVVSLTPVAVATPGEERFATVAERTEEFALA